MKPLCRLMWGVCFLGTQWAAGVDNPLSPFVSGDVVQYQGEFYGMSAETNGVMLRSTDLKTWGHPVELKGADFGDRLRDYELFLWNGAVHLYGEGLGYTAALSPDGPYFPWAKSAIGQADLRFFQDSDGQLMTVFRKEGVKKEGEVWIRPCATPWKPSGRDRMLLDGRRGVWDSLDSADLGDPDLLAYRGQYYMLYAANSPSPRSGLREFGVAVSDKSPLKIDNENKDPNVVIGRNLERIERGLIPIMHTGELAEWHCRYQIKPPLAGWQLPEYKTAGWRSGAGGFGAPAEDRGAQLHACRNKWESKELWIRREFELEKETAKRLVLKIRHEGAAVVFLNGMKVYQSKEPLLSYQYVDITDQLKGKLRVGDNLLAAYVSASKKTPYHFFDFGLYGRSDELMEPAISTLSTPSIMTGPNGFEKWMSYQAYWNGVPGMGMDRVFFFDKALYVDGPTTAETKGYHPDPALPTFSDRFEEDDLASNWELASGQWAVTDGELFQKEHQGVARAYLKRAPAKHYLFESSINFGHGGSGSAGVVAYHDGAYSLLISVHPKKKIWTYAIEPSGLFAAKKFKLPSLFNEMTLPAPLEDHGVRTHRLKVLKNGGYFDVFLDDVRLTKDKPIITKLTGAGVPGLCSDDAMAKFDGVVYTIGWDEFGHYITGWGAAADGTGSSGDWRLDKDDGLEQKKYSEMGRAFKGDLLDAYEFTVNARTERLEDDKGHEYGVFPVFVDRQNYLRAVVNSGTRELVVTGKKAGQDMTPVIMPLARKIERRHLYDTETSYRDMYNWIYRLPSESIVTGMDIRWREGEHTHWREEFMLPGDDLFLQYAWVPWDRKVAFEDDARFFDADEPQPTVQKSMELNPFVIREVKANYMAFNSIHGGSVIVDENGKYVRPNYPESHPDYQPLGAGEFISDDATTSDEPIFPHEVLVRVALESSYFFRCVKLKDKVIIELNGEPMVEIEGAWPPSQVGLFSQDQACFFDGMTLMQLPQKRGRVMEDAPQK